MQPSSRMSSRTDHGLHTGAVLTRTPLRSKRKRNHALGRCHQEVTTTTSPAPSSRASTATWAAFSAVIRARLSQMSGRSAPRQARRISSASGRPESTTASASALSSKARASRAEQIGCSPLAAPFE